MLKVNTVIYSLAILRRGFVQQNKTNVAIKLIAAFLHMCGRMRNILFEDIFFGCCCNTEHAKPGGTVITF